MIINFQRITEEQIFGFKGGEGELLTHNYMDDRARIMRSILKPGARSGLHEHAANCEVIYILQGTMTFHYDGLVEEAKAGEVHYCPIGHSHWFENLTDKDVHYFAVVI
jgi:quercetin dioxygenase-like cupin family protein